jgi:hypothetical protein
MDKLTWIPARERDRRELIRLKCHDHSWAFLEKQLSTDLPGDRAVVGLAMWSDYDIEFFETLASSSILDHSPLAFFDMEDVRTEDDFQEFIPGGHLPLRTPIMAVIRSGKLTEQIEGNDVLSIRLGAFAKLLTSIRPPDPSA